MIRATCPICGKPLLLDRWDDLPTFPFCSARCRLVDLGRWADGAYAIPGPAVRDRDPESPEPDDDGSDD